MLGGLGGDCADVSSPQLRRTFDLPSSTHTYWVNVLLFPDDAQEARIMFKQHVCDLEE